MDLEDSGRQVVEARRYVQAEGLRPQLRSPDDEWHARAVVVHLHLVGVDAEAAEVVAEGRR